MQSGWAQWCSLLPAQPCPHPQVKWLLSESGKPALARLALEMVLPPRHAPRTNPYFGGLQRWALQSRNHQPLNLIQVGLTERRQYHSPVSDHRPLQRRSIALNSRPPRALAEVTTSPPQQVSNPPQGVMQNNHFGVVVAGFQAWVCFQIKSAI